MLNNISVFFSGMEDPRLLRSLVILLIFYLLRLSAGVLIRKYVVSLRTRFVWRQTVNIILLSLVLPFLVIIWFAEFRTILTGLSLVAAALTIISKEFLVNIMAYLVIVWRAVFTIGDRIQIGTVSGDVIHHGIMYISIAEIGGWARGDGYTGRTVKVPNSKVLTESVANYTRGLSLIWEELTFDFHIDASPQKVKAMGMELVTEFGYHLTEDDRESLSRVSEEIMFSYSVPSAYVTPEDGKYRLALRYLCKFHKRRAVAQLLIDRMLEKIEGNKELRLYQK